MQNAAKMSNSGFFDRLAISLSFPANLYVPKKIIRKNESKSKADKEWEGKISVPRAYILRDLLEEREAGWKLGRESCWNPVIIDCRYR